MAMKRTTATAITPREILGGAVQAAAALSTALPLRSLAAAPAAAEEGTGGEPLTKRLAELALKPKTDAIPKAAYEAAKKLVLDTVGVAIGGHRAGGVPEVVEQVRDWGGKPEATLLIYGDRLPAPAKPEPIPWAGSGGRYHGVKVRTKDGKTYTSFRTHRDALGPENTMAMNFVLCTTT
jgi:hypothetical protein